jgi:hypothetical protein
MEATTGSLLLVGLGPLSALLLLLPLSVLLFPVLAELLLLLFDIVDTRGDWLRA